MSSIAGDVVVASEVANEWVGRFAEAVEARDHVATAGMLDEGAWWRDLLALDWDFSILHGRDAIAAMLKERLGESGVRNVTPDPGKEARLNEPAPDVTWVEAFFSFETDAGEGKGVIRLVSDETSGHWLAWNVLTTLEDIRGHERAIGPRRPLGNPTDEAPNWADARAEQLEFRDHDPDVIVIGAGQGGLSVAAQLGLMGISTLVIERNARVGDNWRERYRSLVLHDPVWANHLPYMNFPDSWPVYMPKDKLADWLEHYASAMELNVWTGAGIDQAAYEESSGQWRVEITREDGQTRTLRPRHIVLASGALGRPNVPSFRGEEDFSGTLIHSSEFTGADGCEGKRVAVIGSCNSGHDISQELYEHGAEVTMVQRSSTYVMTQENGIPVIFGALYYEDGPSLEEADLMNLSFPFPVVLDFARAQTEVIAEADRKLLEGLENAGFKTDMGDDGRGLMSRALSRGGGYYIDVGCSQLIADGKIGIESGAPIERFDSDGIVFEDGRRLDADMIILATGYSNMRERARDIFGDRFADGLGLVWDLDEQGEIRTLWRDSGHPAFWFMGGPLAMTRPYSKLLALQITASIAGILER